MNHKSATIRAVSLNQIAEEMKLVLGDRAPARITLHRHSEAGLLRHLAIRPKGNAKRLLYNADAVIAHYGTLKDKPQRANAKKVIGGAVDPSPHVQQRTVVGTQHAEQHIDHPHKRISEDGTLAVAPRADVHRPGTPAPAPSAPPLDAQAIAETISRLATPLIEAQVSRTLAPLQNLLQRLDQSLGTLDATRTSLMLKYDATAALTQQKLEHAQQELLRLRGADNLDLQVARIQKDVSRLQDAIQDFISNARQ
jgi:hypothetical protein